MTDPVARRVVLATQNAGKVLELAALLREPRLELVGLSAVLGAAFDVEETATTFEGNARLKAVAVCAETGLPALADDSGLEVDALGGAPGVYSKRYGGPGASDADNNRKLLAALADSAARTARFRCVLALAVPRLGGAPEVIACVSGTCEGHIARAAAGSGGFGYDPLFVADAFPDQSLAELSADQKNSVSHRAAAARALGGAWGAWLRAD